MTETKKRQPRRTIQVNYYHPKTEEFLGCDLIKAAPFSSWGDIAELQKAILALYVEADAEINTLFDAKKGKQAEFFSFCLDLLDLIPVVGQEKPVDFQALVKADDWPQITRLFVTTSYDEAGNREVDEKGEPTLVKPGLIASLHELNFLRILVEAEQARQEKQKAEKAEELEVVATTK